MLYDVAEGFLLACRRWRQAGAIMLIMTAVSLVLSLILGDVLTQAESLRAGQKLRQSQAVSLSPFYPSNQVSSISAQTTDLLAQELENQQAYSAIINNLAIEDPESLNNRASIVVIGDLATALFPQLGLTCTAPCLLQGHDLAQDQPLNINFRGRIIPVAGSLKQGSVWFDANASGLNLDQYQLLFLSPQDIGLLNSYEKEELLTRAILLNPAPEKLEKLLSSAAQDKLYLVPADLSLEQPEQFASLMSRAAIYLLSLLAFSALAALVYAASLQEIISQQKRAFIIRRMCGAHSLRLGVRLHVFLAATTAALPLLLCLVLYSLGPPVSAGAQVMAVLIVLSYLGISYYALRRIKKEGPIR